MTVSPTPSGHPDAGTAGPAHSPKDDFLHVRRRLLQGIAMLPLALSAGRGLAQPADMPANWASGHHWLRLQRALGHRLFRITMPDLESETGKRLLASPSALGDEAALTQSSGWVNGWQSVPSLYAARIRDAREAAQVVNFARSNKVRLVIRGGGHSYHGTSCAPNSLMIWTRGLDSIEVHDRFTPSGAQSPAVPAVSVGAGCVWGKVYDFVTRQHGRYVQGGGCTTVGVAGLVLGGGFGNFSKRYGLAAASLLEAEIVTADGQIRIVNADQEPDLFWALKGGGGGSFGVVTRLTLATHDLPETFGAIHFEVEALSDAAFRSLIKQFLSHYRTRLFNPHWGEQIVITPHRQLIGEMVFQGLGADEVREDWSDFMEFVASDPVAFRIRAPLQVIMTPARLFWDAANMNRLIPGVMTIDVGSPEGSSGFWWTGDGHQVGQMHYGMESLWLSQRLLSCQAKNALADALFDASRLAPISLQFNKGLAGCDTLTGRVSAETAINPNVLDAFCLALISSSGEPCYPGQNCRTDLVKAHSAAHTVRRAMQILRAVSPNSGCYLYESDYHLVDAPDRFWGKHCQRLREIKQRYDPTNLFQVHNGIGSSVRLYCGQV